MTNKLIFSDIEYKKIFTIDISKLITKEYIDKFNTLRNTRQWLFKINDILQDTYKNNTHDIYFDDFIYPEIGLSSKIPVLKEYMNRYAPLAISFSIDHSMEKFIISEILVKIHQEGSLTITITANSIKETSWEIDDFVSDLENLKNDIYKLYINALNTIVENSKKINIDLHLSIPEQIDLYTIEYEIILFNYNMNNGQMIFPKDMCKKENLHILRQLIGFSRLARSIAWENYSYDFCLNFYNKNIGSRDDEYWLIYKERFIRFFPNNNDKKSLYWLHDAVSVIEILLAKKAMLLYVVDWTKNELESFSNINIHGNTLDSSDLTNQVYTSLTRTYYLMSIIHEPLIIKRYIKHDFFDTFFKNFNAELKISLLINEAKDLIANLNQINSLMANYLYSKTNLLFQNIISQQVDSQKKFNKIITNENRKIEKRNLTIAFVGLLIGIAQIIDNNLIKEILKHIEGIPINTFSVFFYKILLIVTIPSLFLLTFYMVKSIFKISKFVWKFLLRILNYD